VPPVTAKPSFSLACQGQLQDYVTAMAWSPKGDWLAIASGAGEVVLIPRGYGKGAPASAPSSITLSPSTGQSIDCLGFSHDGQFLAAAGQASQVSVWQLPEPLLSEPLSPQAPSLWQVLDCSASGPKPVAQPWVEHLAWSPTRLELAFSLGRYVQIWNAAQKEIVTTLPFENSSVLGLVWHPKGEQLVAHGHLAVKTWSRQAWEDDPKVNEMVAASIAIAISSDGQFLASGNLDSTLVVWEWDSPHPWRMTGFPGKVRHLAWADSPAKLLLKSTAMVAAASGSVVIVWRKLATDEAGWRSRALDIHLDKIVALAFQPGTELLASAAEDGRTILWHKAKQLGQVLDGPSQGFSGLAWHPKGTFLAAGGQQGEWFIWAEGSRSRGFAR
jgi:WD40 repeat protein